MLDKLIQPVANGFLNNTVTLSEGVDLSALLAADRRENAFSRLLTLRLLTHLVEFFQSDIVEPTHYIGLLSMSVKIFSRPYNIESLTRNQRVCAVKPAIVFRARLGYVSVPRTPSMRSGDIDGTQQKTHT
ncbi:hypothetical protein C451_02572 [Halococcus thailandensis JCM 13552]|uniref:Uncharacterized protein n=1 Tax=Halococcus thailandensis JCM 13552 TaxID=1227457 RepID=M0NFR6_9EURY|nr:hypothetical protein C451_02572 [Halococcus thailandensis JCM 13552]